MASIVEIMNRPLTAEACEEILVKSADRLCFDIPLDLLRLVAREAAKETDRWGQMRIMEEGLESLS